MTYRQKLLLKRGLIIAAIVIVLIIVLLIAGYAYLGRYVVYTEDGAYFAMGSEDIAVSEYEALASPPEDPVLVTGESILEADIIGDVLPESLDAQDVYGIMLDYDTLSSGSNLGSIEFTETGYNTLLLEMRKEGSDILKNSAVLNLIERAKLQDIRVVAVISTLDDSDYALENFRQAFPIAGGALWVGRGHSYWLDPTTELVHNYLLGMIDELIEMGFDEVLLRNYYFPESASLSYDTGNSTRALLLEEAYEKLEEAVRNRCTLGLYIQYPDEDPLQAMYAAEHVYVYFASGATLKSFSETYTGAYLVFVTDSHDTRFDDYGKISCALEDILPTSE